MSAAAAGARWRWHEDPGDAAEGEPGEGEEGGRLLACHEVTPAWLGSVLPAIASDPCAAVPDPKQPPWPGGGYPAAPISAASPVPVLG